MQAKGKKSTCLIPGPGTGAGLHLEGSGIPAEGTPAGLGDRDRRTPLSN